jgi:hypothetical protein
MTQSCDWHSLLTEISTFAPLEMDSSVNTPFVPACISMHSSQVRKCLCSPRHLSHQLFKPDLSFLSPVDCTFTPLFSYGTLTYLQKLTTGLSDISALTSTFLRYDTKVSRHTVYSSWMPSAGASCSVLMPQPAAVMTTQLWKV